MSKQQPIKKQPTSTYGAIAVLIGVILFIIFAIIPAYSNRVPAPEAAPQIMATLDPTIIANVTALPEMQAPTGAEAEQLHQLQTQVAACGEYSDARRSQMDQHIQWLLNPSTIPPEIMIAAGQNPLGKLVFGMAVYTSSEWRLHDRPTDSCLIAIGRTLNAMLTAAGETPLTIYDE